MYSFQSPTPHQFICPRHQQLLQDTERLQQTPAPRFSSAVHATSASSGGHLYGEETAPRESSRIALAPPPPPYSVAAPAPAPAPGPLAQALGLPAIYLFPQSMSAYPVSEPKNWRTPPSFGVASRSGAVEGDALREARLRFGELFMDNFRRLLEEESHQRNGITIDFFTSYPRFSPVHASASQAASQAAPSTWLAAVAPRPSAVQAVDVPRASVSPKESPDFVASPNYLEFEGQYWYLILKYRSSALRTAFLADTADALSLPPSCVSDLRFAQTQLVAHFTVRHSPALSAAQVKQLLDAHAYTRVWKIYQAVLNLFDDQFADTVSEVRPSDLEALVQRVYSGEDGDRGVAPHPATTTTTTTTTKSAAAPVSPLAEPLVKRTTARGSVSVSMPHKAAPLEDSISFEGDYRSAAALHRQVLEKAVSSDITCAVAAARDVVVRDITADATRLSVRYGITAWAHEVALAEVRQALLAYPFPETWKWLLDAPPVVKTAATAPSSAQPRGLSVQPDPPAVSAPARTEARPVRRLSVDSLSAAAGVPGRPVPVTVVRETVPVPVRSAHRLRVVGDSWDTVLDADAAALRAACTRDAVAATAGLGDCVVVVTALAIEDDGALSVELSAQHAPDVTNAAVDAALAAHSLGAVWCVYDSVHAPLSPAAPAHTAPAGWTVMAHTAHLDGSAWAPILQTSSDAVARAFVGDVCEALGLPESCVAVSRTAFTGFLVIEYTVQRPLHMTVAMVNRGVDAAPMTRMWQVYRDYLRAAGVAAKSTTSSLFADGSAARSNTRREDDEVVSRRPSHVEEGRRKSSTASARSSLPDRGDLVTTTHIIVLDGDRWDVVVNTYPESVRDAARSDFCRANEADREAVSQVTLHLIPNGVRAAVDFAHSPSVPVQLITERLERCEMNSTWDLYAEVLTKLADSATPRSSRGGSLSSPRRSSAARAVTNHALLFDEPLLFARPASVTAAVKKDLNPVLEPLGGRVVDVNMEKGDDGVTVLYTVSHAASVPSKDVDAAADAADMQNVWDLADELAAEAEAKEAAGDQPSKSSTLPPASTTPLPPPLRSWEAAPAQPTVAPRGTVRVANAAETTSTPLARAPAPLPRLFAGAEEEVSVAGSLSRLSSRMAHITAAAEEEEEEAHTPAATPVSQDRAAPSRRPSHASLASRRSSLVAGDRPSTRASNSSAAASPHAQVSMFCVYFEGSSWARVLALHPQEFIDSLAGDVSEALAIDLQDVLNVIGEYADGLVAHYELLCPVDRMQEVNGIVDASPMRRTWSLYDQVALTASSTTDRPRSVHSKSGTSADGRRLSHSALTGSVAEALSRRVSVDGDAYGASLTRHAVYFDGPDWAGVLSEHENKLRLALIHDLTTAIAQPASTLTQLDLEYADGLLVEYELTHPPTLGVAAINELVDASPMTRTWDLFGAHQARDAAAPESPLKPLVATAEMPPRLRAVLEESPRLFATAEAAPRTLSSVRLSTHVDAEEMPHPPRRFMESGRHERPFRARASEAVEVRQYHTDDTPTPNELQPLETLEDTEEDERDIEMAARALPDASSAPDVAACGTSASLLSATLSVMECAMEFDGSQWDALLDAQAPRLMDAFMADVSEALDMPATVIRGVDLFAVDGLTVNYMLKLPDDLDEAHVNHCTDGFEFPRTWQLYDHFTNGDGSKDASASGPEQPWTDFVREFEGPLWPLVLPRHDEEVRQRFVADVADLFGITADRIRVMHTPVDDGALFVHFASVLPAGLEAVMASSLLDSGAFPRVTAFYTECVAREADPLSAQGRAIKGSRAASVATDEDGGSEAERSPLAPHSATVEPPPPLTVDAVTAPSAEPAPEEIETSVHTVYVEGFWNPIAVDHKAALKQAFAKDVVHAVGIPPELVTQVEPLAFRHGLLVTYVVAHDNAAARDGYIGDVDELLDADPLDNMWELYRLHDGDAEAGASRTPRASLVSGLVAKSPHARHNSLGTDFAVNPLITGDIADRYYSMLFEGSAWPQVLARERPNVRRCFVEDCINGLRTEDALSPHAVKSVQVITEVPLHEGMLVHYVVDKADPDQREAIDDLVTQYAFPLTWAIYDAHMQQTCGSPRNSTWVAARRSRSRATSYAYSPDTARLYNAVAYADDPAKPQTVTGADSSVHTRVPSPTLHPSSPPGPASRPATSHRSLTSFRVHREPRRSLLSAESFDSLDDLSEHHSSRGTHPHASQTGAQPLHASEEASPDAAVWLESPRKSLDAARGEATASATTMDNFTFPAGSPPSEADLPPTWLFAVEAQPPRLVASDHCPAHPTPGPSASEVSRMPPSPPSSHASDEAPQHDQPLGAEDWEAPSAPAAPQWLYAFDFEPARPPSLVPPPGMVYEPIDWVPSPTAVGADSPSASSEGGSREESIIELPVSPSQWVVQDLSKEPAQPLYDNFYQPPLRPAQQHRIVVLDHAVAPREEFLPADAVDRAAALPGHNDGNVIVVIQRTALDVDGLLDKLGQLEDLVRNRCDNLRDLFESI